MFATAFAPIFEPVFYSNAVDTSLDWENRVIANGGTIDSTTRTAVQSFIEGCIADGIWDKINRINLFAGEQLAAALVPLKIGSGSLTDTNNNFVSGDYVKTTGLTGNGSTKYLNTGLVATSLTTNDSHLSVVNQSAAPGIDGLHGANAGASSYFGFYAPYLDSIVYAYQYNQTAGQGRLASSALMVPTGVTTTSRTASNAHAVYSGGESVGSNSTTGGTMPAQAIYIFAVNGSGTAASFRGDTLCGYTIGSGLSSTDAEKLSDRIIAFNLAIGRGAWHVGSVAHATNLNEPEDVLIDGNYAYIPCRSGGLTIGNVTDPTSPSIVTSFTDSDISQGMGVAKNGNTVYLTSWHNHKLVCIDVTTPASPSKLGSVTVGNTDPGGDPDELRKLAYKSGYCFCCHRFDQKLYVVDVSNPASPSVAASVALGFGAFAVVISGNYAYVASFPDADIKVVDITDPLTPTVVKTISTSAGIGGLVVSGNNLFACWFTTDKVVSYDITDPPNSTVISELTSATLGAPNRISIHGNYLYVASSTGDGVVQVNATNTASMSIGKTIFGPPMDKCYGVTTSGSYVYAVARDADRLGVFQFGE